MTISGGGSTGPNTGRGGYVTVYGTDNGGAGLGGDVRASSGDNGNIVLNTNGTGHIVFMNANEAKLNIPDAASNVVDIAYGTGVANGYAIIRSNTSDGTDSSRFILAPSSSPGVTRGGYIQLDGSDRGSAGAGGDILLQNGDSGDITLNASNAGGVTNQTDTGKILLSSTGGGDVELKVASTGDIIFNGSAGNNYIYFKTYNENKWDIPPAGAASSELRFGTGNTAYTGIIKATTANGYDLSVLKLAAGGTPTDSGRGAFIDLYGEDTGSTGGMDISTGDGGIMYISAPGNGGTINFKTYATYRWQIPSEAAGRATLIYGPPDTPTAALITGSTLDGNDGNTVTINGGGGTSVGTTRGAFIEIEGRDVGGGDLGGDINIHAVGPAGMIYLRTGATSEWSLDQNGHLAFNGPTSGWVAKNGAGAHCHDTCGLTSGCLFGFDQATNTFKDCDSGDSDTCICSQ